MCFPSEVADCRHHREVIRPANPFRPFVLGGNDEGNTHSRPGFPEDFVLQKTCQKGSTFSYLRRGERLNAGAPITRPSRMTRGDNAGDRQLEDSAGERSLLRRSPEMSG